MEGDRRVYCPLIPGLCNESWDCEECGIFDEAMLDMELEPAWVCSTCLSPGGKPSGRTLLGFYQEGECDECATICVVLQAAVDVTAMSPKTWRKVLEEIRVEAFSEEE